ncbi:uncharacterized protein LOC141715020 [Apium graveolens]|uniref:uncharacterized protein LOC141715020 n=1 Tax=Apium graveolens TaxID=4045 RepID=UPI003D79AB76
MDHNSSVTRQKHFANSWNIGLIKSTPRYPQANGQAESSNKIIINNLKRRLMTCKGKWAEELSWVLWSDRTTPKTSTGQTPYSLVYELSHNKDIVDELREMAKNRVAAYQQRIANVYNKHVHIRIFRVGDMVLRKTFQNTMDVTAEKFDATWKGPYLIDAVVGRGAYRLSTMDGTQKLLINKSIRT